MITVKQKDINQQQTVCVLRDFVEVFMAFVKSYIQLFAYGSVTTEEWKNYLFAYFKDKVRSFVGFD